MKPETKELTLESIAAEASKFFVSKTKDDGKNFTIYTDDRPQWVEDLVFEAHGDKLPDDYIYEWIDSALKSIAGGMTEDNIYDYVDSEVDCYTSGLTEWLNSRNDRVYYLTDALNQCEQTDGFELLGMAQYQEIGEVFNSVLNSITERLEGKWQPENG